MSVGIDARTSNVSPQCHRRDSNDHAPPHTLVVIYTTPHHTTPHHTTPQTLPTPDLVLLGRSSAPYGSLDGLGVIGITSSGTIGFVGGEAELAASAIDMSSVANKIDMGGRWVTPGLIDCHTHAVHAGNRAAEWELKIGGATYEEVARAGGGIIASISAAREADVESLLDQSHARIARSVTNVGAVTRVQI